MLVFVHLQQYIAKRISLVANGIKNRILFQYIAYDRKHKLGTFSLLRCINFTALWL